MTSIVNRLRTGRRNILKTITESLYGAELPRGGNLGEMFASQLEALRDPGVAAELGVNKEVLNKIRQVKNARVGGASRAGSWNVDPASVAKAARTGKDASLIRALDASHRARIKGGTLFGAGIGFLTGLADPDSSAVGTALRYGAEGFLFETFMPTMQYLFMGSALVQLGAGVAGGISRANNERLYHVMSGRGLYSQHDPTENKFAGNLRRQSMGYMLQSKQNTRSFIGSEAAYMHATT